MKKHLEIVNSKNYLQILYWLVPFFRARFIYTSAISTVALRRQDIGQCFFLSNTSPCSAFSLLFLFLLGRLVHVLKWTIWHLLKVMYSTTMFNGWTSAKHWKSGYVCCLLDRTLALLPCALLNYILCFVILNRCVHNDQSSVTIKLYYLQNGSARLGFW
jgi:hypothetical protein